MSRLRLWSVLSILLLTACSRLSVIDPYQSGVWTTAFVLEGERPLLTLLTSVPKAHLVVIDPLTGERVSTGVLPCATPGARPELFPPADGLSFVRCGPSEVSVVDLRTGQITVAAERIVSANPELASGFRLAMQTITYDVSAPTRGLALTLHDGRTAWLDLDGRLHAEPVMNEPWRPGYFCWPEHRCSRVRRECLGFEKAASTHGYVLFSTRKHGEPDRPSTMIGQWPAGLIRPGLVGEPESRCAFERDGSHLILHDSAAFEPKQTQLSLIRRDGTSLWSQPYETLGATDRHQPRQAVDLGDRILLLIGHTGRRSYLRAVVVDAATGAVLAGHDVFGRAG